MRNEDCIAGMQKIRKKSVDLIITDPPFAIEFGARKTNYNRKGSRVLQGYGEIAQSEYAKFTHNWMEQAYRTLKESGSMYDYGMVRAKAEIDFCKWMVDLIITDPPFAR